MADPREFGLTAADLRAAADLMYGPGDDRLPAMKWNHAAQVKAGRIRSRLRAMADAIEGADAVDVPAAHVSQQAMVDVTRMWRDAFGTEP
jgi:hypothetical protein